MNFLYDAFISYRHKELDAAVAKTLHKQLETYSIPAYIKKKSDKKKMGKVFRDQDEMPLMADLGEGIREALRRSEWLIVICTPDFPESKWCMAEVDYFIELGRRDNILTVLVSGEPDESFPTQLRFADGEEREPLAADVRAADARGTIRKLRNEKLRLLAPMLGVGYDDLRRRQRERVLRTVMAASLSAAAFFAAFGGFAAYQAATIARQNEELLTQKSRIYAGFAEAELAAGNRAGAGLLTLEALPGGIAPSQEARDALYRAAYGEYSPRYPDVKTLMRAPDGIAVPAPDGKTFAVSSGDATRLYDANTFRSLYENAGALTPVEAFQRGEVTGARLIKPVYSKDGSKVFLPNGNPVLLDAHSGEVLREGFFTDAAELPEYGLSAYESKYSYPDRYVIDLETGDKLFDVTTPETAAKVLFSPDGRYYAIAARSGLQVYDIQRRELAGELPCDKMSVENGYTFFTPDSRFLVLTRSKMEAYSFFDAEKNAEVYTIQLVEIPSCRVVYENELISNNPAAASGLLINYYNMEDSDMPALLCAPDGSRIILPVSDGKLEMFDLVNNETIWEKTVSRRFFSFAPSGDRFMALGANGDMAVYDAQTGEELLSYGGEASYARGYILPESNMALLGSSLVELKTQDDTPAPEMFFHDESGRYIRPGGEGGAAVINAKTPDAAPVTLENSAAFTSQELLYGAGNIVAGVAVSGNGEADGAITIWDAETGKRLRTLDANGEKENERGRSISEQYSIGNRLNKSAVGVPFTLSSDGKRIAALYYKIGVSEGGIIVFDAASGEKLTETELGSLSNYILLFDKDVTKALYINENIVKIFDVINGSEPIDIDDYPEGQLAIGAWSGHRAAISGDGKIIAVSHSKKAALELIDAETGQRLHEIPLPTPAAAEPCFSHDGSRVTICAEKDMLTVDVVTGETLYSVYDETAFDQSAYPKPDYAWSEDDKYLLGVSEIRDAETGARVCSVLPPARPAWDIAETDGAVIPVGSCLAIYLPALEEAASRLREQIREYDFPRADKLRYAIER